jgi:hypothetical protein
MKDTNLQAFKEEELLTVARTKSMCDLRWGRIRSLARKKG